MTLVGVPLQGRKRQAWDPSVPFPGSILQVLVLLSCGTAASLCPTGGDEQPMCTVPLDHLEAACPGNRSETFSIFLNLTVGNVDLAPRRFRNEEEWMGIKCPVPNYCFNM